MARPRENTDEELLERVEGALRRRRSLTPWSLAEVAAVAGVAPATLVKRFGSRQGLLVALSRRWIDSIPTEQPEGTAPQHALVAWVEENFAPAKDRGAAVAGIQFLLGDLSDPELTALLREGWARQIAYLAQLLSAIGLARLGDPDRAATVLFDSLNGARLRAAAGDADTSPIPTLERLLEAWT